MVKWGGFKSATGSVLMEFVLVLPLYLVTLGGIFALGFRALDTINLRSADHWLAWAGGYRFGVRPATSMWLNDLFPRRKALVPHVARALTAEKAYIQVIGAKHSLYLKEPEFVGNLLNLPLIMAGDAPRPRPSGMISSVYGSKPYSGYILMRTKGSQADSRHWHSSLVADQEIWKFNQEEYAEDWVKLLDQAKFTDDNPKRDKAPDKIEFYERYKTYEKWSKNP